MPTLFPWKFLVTLFFSEGLLGGKEVLPSTTLGLGVVFLPSLSDSECVGGSCKSAVEFLSTFGY